MDLMLIFAKALQAQVQDQPKKQTNLSLDSIFQSS